MTNYLLGTDANGNEDVYMYSAADMLHVFSESDRATLAAGEFVQAPGIRWIDMQVAARRNLQTLSRTH
jgi:hypothetical protein